MKEKEVSVCSTGRRPGKRAKTCRHSSSSGGPSGPSTFVEELIEPVLAQLSLRQIAELNRDSSLWAAMLQTSSFKRLCAAAHPEMGYRGFGLVGWHYDDKDVMRVTLFDTKSNKWTHVDLTDFPEEKEYEDAMCASDGGLVCFVPIDSRSEKKMAAAALPILVCNPLTSEWKSLPLSPIAGRRQIILVQLVVDEDTKCYRVILVYADKLGAARGAFFYDSRTGLWSKQNAGLVYGAGNTLYNGQQDPHVFDCAHKVLHNLNLGTTLGLPGSRMYSVVKDHLFVLDYLRESDGTSNGGTFNGGTSGTYELMECDWETNVVHSMRKLQTHSGTVNFALGDDEDQEHHAVLLPCSDFILLAWDINDDLNVDMSDQEFKLFDKSANRWYDIPTLDFGDSRIRLLELDGSLMCDLRWDVIP